MAPVPSNTRISVADLVQVPVFCCLLLSTCRVEAVKSLYKCGLQNPQEDRWIPVFGAHVRAEQLLTDTAQQQAVEVLPVQQPVHILEEESFTEPAEFSSSVVLGVRTR